MRDEKKSFLDWIDPRQILSPNDIPSQVTNNIVMDTNLFFDLDGTLVDTNRANFLAYKAAIKLVTTSDYGLRYTPGDRITRCSLKKIVPDIGEDVRTEIIRQKELHYRNFMSETKLNKSLCNILFRYSQTNKTVLVTNCREDRANTTLDYFQLKDQFSHLFFRRLNCEGKKINKYKAALSVLQISPGKVIAFENEAEEIADAAIAGIQLIHHITL